MKYIDEFSDPSSAAKLAEEINMKMARIGRPVRLMEVCGTHTMNIGRAGLRKMLSEQLCLLSGPGCPVCVTPSEFITKSIMIAEEEDVIITTFGDMVRVPNTAGRRLSEFPTEKVRIVYTPLEALEIAGDEPSKRVVFLGVGFETTAPTVAQTIMNASNFGSGNFFCLSAHKIIPPALTVLAGNPDSMIDGFILPGHVSVIIGLKGYEKIDMRGVVTGFEPIDILKGIVMLLDQIIKGEQYILNAYERAVTYEGNNKMKAVMDEVFVLRDSNWRGFSTIGSSGYLISKKYSDYDASKEFSFVVDDEEEPAACRCAEVLQGICSPAECPLFAGACSPEDPVGPCMVSSEGACSAYYKYER